MSSAMDKALLAMSLEEVEEEVPFEMPDLPEYLSVERNTISLIGRTLNLPCQPMKNLIRDMLRKWQKLGRMRGVALSNERFQFIFDSEQDLVEVLAKGAHTYNDWSIVVDRWYENPPANYLQRIPIWVQIWNLPVNYYTTKAITALGELIGEVLEVAFDSDKPQIQEFVRVKVLFDVSRPLRRSKELRLPFGESTVVRFQYERVQKRCFECQRLTHEKDVCPILIRKLEVEAEANKEAKRIGETVEKSPKSLLLKEEDPLFGILREDQVGIDPATRRQRIAIDVLEGMRQYLLVNNNEDWQIKADRIRKSVGEAERDPIAKKTILRLEPAPVVHSDINKEKGLVINFEGMEGVSPSDRRMELGPQGIIEVERVSDKRVGRGMNFIAQDSNSFGSFLALSQPFQDGVTGFRTGFSEPSSSGSKSKSKRGKPRNRPPSRIRKLKTKDNTKPRDQPQPQLDLTQHANEKRKAEGGGTSTAKYLKLNPPKVIPKEGSPKA